MAELPHAKEAVVPQNKVENYLLNPGHPIGAGKAKFFVTFGFDVRVGKPLPLHCIGMRKRTLLPNQHLMQMERFI